MDVRPERYGLGESGGRFTQNTQIYESTNQIQRVVVARPPPG